MFCQFFVLAAALASVAAKPGLLAGTSLASVVDEASDSIAVEAPVGYAASAPVVHKAALEYAPVAYRAGPIVYKTVLEYAAAPVTYSAAPLAYNPGLSYAAAPVSYSAGFGYKLVSPGLRFAY